MSSHSSAFCCGSNAVFAVDSRHSSCIAIALAFAVVVTLAATLAVTLASAIAIHLSYILALAQLISLLFSPQYLQMHHCLIQNMQHQLLHLKEIIV